MVKNPILLEGEIITLFKIVTFVWPIAIHVFHLNIGPLVLMSNTYVCFNINTNRPFVWEVPEVAQLLPHGTTSTPIRFRLFSKCVLEHYELI